MKLSLGFLNKKKQYPFRELGHRMFAYPKPRNHEKGVDYKTGMHKVQSFKVYTSKILNEMEDSIEAHLLKDVYNKLPSPLLKKELLAAYKRRRLNVAEMKQFQEPFRLLEPIPPKPLYDYEDIYIHTPTGIEMYDIGKFKMYSDEEKDTIFPMGTFGYYEDFFYKKTKKFGLMCTEEGFAITNEMRKLNYQRLTKQDYDEIFSHIEEPGDAKLLLNDEELYVRILHDLKISMQPKVFEMRSDEIMSKVFAEAFLFDALCNMLAKQMRGETMRFNLIDLGRRERVINQLFDQIKEKIYSFGEYVNPTNVSYMMKKFKSFTFDVADPADPSKTKQVFIPLKKLANNIRRPPTIVSEHSIKGFTGFNSGIMLYGKKGTGKSGTLMYIASWAYANDWILFVSPGGYNICNGSWSVERHTDRGVYMHLDLTSEFLNGFKKTNAHLLAKIPVNMKYYGHYDAVGVRDDEPAIYKPEYIKERETWSNTWEEWLDEEVMKEDKVRMQRFQSSCREELPEPKTLMDIVQCGIENKDISTSCFYELIEQLYHLESHRICFVVDDYNYFFRPSIYGSFRYQNYKEWEGKIPAHHMMFARPFMSMDMHKFKNGFKVCGSGLKDLFKHEFTPRHIELGAGYSLEMKGLPYDDYHRAWIFWDQSGLLQSRRNRAVVDQNYLEHQGNWWYTMNDFRAPAKAYAM